MLFIEIYRYVNNIFNEWANHGERNIRNLYPQLSRNYDSETIEPIKFYTLCY